MSYILRNMVNIYGKHVLSDKSLPIFNEWKITGKLGGTKNSEHDQSLITDGANFFHYLAIFTI